MHTLISYIVSEMNGAFSRK